MQCGVNECHGAPAIKLVEHGIECQIAEKFTVVACEQAHTLEAQDIERVFDLGDRVLDLPHRHESESAEALGPSCYQFRGIFVELACQDSRLTGCGELNTRL